MKHSIRITISALLLSLSVLNLAANVKENYNGGKDAPPVVSPDIIVTVDDKGQTDGGHHFQKIDDTNFYIDDIKYTAKQGDLVVSGYNDAFFKGVAAIITALKYQGRTMNVTNIQNESFKNCKVITSCIIGNRVTNIGECAFENCRDLTSVTIPNSVTTIGKRTFAGCNSLEYVFCHAVNPPALDQAFDHTSATLYVPSQSYQAYSREYKCFDKIATLPE